MKRTFASLLFLTALLILPACASLGSTRPIPEISTTTPRNSAIVQPTTQFSMQTISAGTAIGVTGITAETHTITPGPTRLASILKIFPLLPGATWVYSDVEYTPDPIDARKTIQAEFEITQTVEEIKTAGDTYLARIQQKVIMVREDPGWSNGDKNSPADNAWWYILSGAIVYSSAELPSDIGKMDLKQLMEEFSFPMQQGTEWCPNKIGKASVGEVATIAPCNPIGKRVVLGDEPYVSFPGPFEKCHQIGDVYNMGGVVQTFCEGVGIVKQEFHHVGTQFGFSKTLTNFKPGKN